MVCAVTVISAVVSKMKTKIEISDEVWYDWHHGYSTVSEPDESNMGDVAEWAVKEYIRVLLGIYSCNFCYKWFETVEELCDHLSENHNTKITHTPRYTEYSEYSNSYNIDSRKSK